MKIRSFGISDRGKVREANEDAFFNDEVHHAYAVADGLGGLPGGADASQRVVELLEKTYSGLKAETERVDLSVLIQEINKIISKEGVAAHPFTGSGSTLTIGQLEEDDFLIAHVGDSAAYLLREEKFDKLTADHTMEQELIDRMGESARATMPREYPHTLTRCLGQMEPLAVDQQRVPLVEGDRLLLCTDGLNKVLSASTLSSLLGDGEDPEVVAKSLVAAANAAAGPDNITAIVIFAEG